jgi:hypothetical protein
MLLHFLKNLINGNLVLQKMKSTCIMFQSHSPFSLSTCFPQTIVSLKKQWLMATPSTKVAQFPLHVRIQNQFVNFIYQTFLKKAIKKPKKAFWYTIIVLVSLNPSDFVPFLMFIITKKIKKHSQNKTKHHYSLCSVLFLSFSLFNCFLFPFFLADRAIPKPLSQSKYNFFWIFL